MIATYRITQYKTAMPPFLSSTNETVSEDASPAARMPEAEVADIASVVQAAAKEVELRAERGTVFCETAVRVQVLLPPPYNTVLPWRLVRALLGKALSTIVSYMLPRFLEVCPCSVSP